MVTQEIAEFISKIRYKDLPERAIEASKRSILDCLGVAIAGCSENTSKIIGEYVKNEGSATAEAGVIGDGFKTSASLAAWANGTKAHVLDYDDILWSYHPTVALLPAVLAIGEKHGLSGKEVLLSYITGLEVEMTVGAASRHLHRKRGWHGTATWGSVGAAGAVAKMLELSIEEIRMALGISASLAGGLRKNFGTMTKSLHAGNAARNGVVAATLAQKGFTADENILDGEFGFCNVVGGTPDCITRGLGTNFHIISPGIAIKPYPSCGGTHRAIDAALSLKREHNISASDISWVHCVTDPTLRNVVIHSRPRTALEAKFSLEFCVSVAFIDGEVSLKQFTDEKVTEPTVQELISKVEYVSPEELQYALDQDEVKVKLRDGKIYSCTVKTPKWAPPNPPTWEEVLSKFKGCVGSAFSAEDTQASIDLVANLELVKDVKQLTDIFTFKANIC